MKKRIISLLMVALMLVSLVPMGAFAVDIGDIIGGGDSTDKVTICLLYTSDAADE